MLDAIPSGTKSNLLIMHGNEEKDFYTELYKSAKISPSELRKYKVCESKTEEELKQLSDLLFDLGLLAQKIMIEL